MGAKVLVLAASLGVLMTVPMLAHHSFGSEYDEKKPLKFENAVVTKVEWTNPHARFLRRCERTRTAKSPTGTSSSPAPMC